MVDVPMIKVTVPCVVCRKVKTIQVTRIELEKWQKGAFVQDAFPNLSKEDREMFVSQMCSECWDKVFPKAEEGDVLEDE